MPVGSRNRFPGNRSIGSCRGAQPHDGTSSSAVRPYCLRSKTWESLRPHLHLCNNALAALKSVRDGLSIADREQARVASIV
ncbi:MAG: hypothetical protein VB125_02440 [Burkholderia sp.]